MSIKRVLSVIVRLFRICIIGEDSFFEKEKIEDGRLIFRKNFTVNNMMKFVLTFAITVLALASLYGSDSFLKKILIILFFVVLMIINVFLSAASGFYNKIIINETGITEIKLWDELTNNGIRTDYKWEDFSTIRVSGGGRGGVNIWTEHKNGMLRFDFTYEIFNFIRQYYPNIDVWIELDESKVK